MQCKLLIFIALFCGLSCIGCVARLDKPNVPKPLSRDFAFALYSIPEFCTHYNAYRKSMGLPEVSSDCSGITRNAGTQTTQASATPASQASVTTDLLKARQLRDLMINRIRVDIEINYREYESKLFFSRGESSLGGDFLELGLAFAGTVSKGERAKSVLASALSGVRGTRLSYDKNFFREKTIEIIVSQMQASREESKNKILDKMSRLPADRYPFEEAWVDLAEFFYSGTLQGGIQALANQAGKAAVNAKDETKKLEIVRTATPDELISIEKVTGSYEVLKAKYNEVKNDPTKAKPFVDQAKAVLAEMKVDLSGTETDQKIFDLVEEEFRKTILQRDRLPKLATAFRNAQILQ